MLSNKFSLVAAVAVLLTGQCAAEEIKGITATARFSPGGGATQAVVDAIGSAKKSVYVLAYSFTSPEIAKALAEANARGVNVVIVLDKSNQTAKYSAATYTTNAGIPTLMDRQHAIAHNKTMVIDDRTVITGSFNFTRAAERSNAENLLILESTGLASEYKSDFDLHRSHSEIVR